MFLSMKMVVGVAVVAAFVGGAIVGFEAPTLWSNWQPIAASAVVAFVGYILMKMLQIMKKLKHELQWIGEKCTYIEQRIDAAAAKSGDICRHLQQVFLEFDAARNEGKTDEVKWWWVERRLRQLYEDFSNSKAMEKCSYEVVKKTWSMLQLECKMRTLRDVVSYRYFEAELLEDDEDMEWALKNMMQASVFCSFWHPMQVNAMEQHVTQSCFEEILTSQIAERVKEVKQYIQGDSMQKYAGLQLEGIIGGSSTS
jgi:hypothetical protein